MRRDRAFVARSFAPVRRRSTFTRAFPFNARDGGDDYQGKEFYARALARLASVDATSLSRSSKRWTTRARDGRTSRATRHVVDDRDVSRVTTRARSSKGIACRSATAF